MSAKDCGNHGGGGKKRLRHFFCGLIVFVFLVLLTILITWAILQPKKPKFIIQDATVYAFNVSSSTNTLTINLQVTLSSRNPNSKIGVYYDRLDVYAVYRSQQITLRTRIPPTYQGHKEVNIWSPFVYGTSAPIAPYNGVLLTQEQMGGEVSLKIKIDGRVRWKVAAFVSGKYHFYVECPAVLTFGNRNTGVVVGGAVKYMITEKCKVST